MRSTRKLLVGGAFLVTSVCLVVGVAAAVTGGSLNAVGAGPGGLNGLPSLFQLVLAAAGTVAAAAELVGRRRSRRTAVLVVGPALVFVSFFQLAHALDPCANGRWGLRTEIAGERACQVWGGGLEIHDRFHLLMHAAPGFVAAALAVAVARTMDRSRPQESLPEPAR